MTSQRSFHSHKSRSRGPYTDRARSERPSPPDRVLIYGVHPVSEALQNPKRKCLKLYATLNGLARVKDLLDLHRPQLLIEEASPRALESMLAPDAVHQGLVLEAVPLFERSSLQDHLGLGTLVFLDQVTDPHNIGAIARTAVAFGARALVTTARHAPHETSVLAKSASGALEHLPLLRVKNLAESLEEARFAGYRLVGLDSEAPDVLQNLRLDGLTALVLGAEGKGLRQKTRSLCDVMVRLDMPGPIKSLNVSNAAAIALYALHSQKV